MPQIIWSPRSQRDLRGIEIFLTERNDAAAVRVLRAIRGTATRLSEHPRIGRELRDDIRVLGVRTTPYLLIYRVQGPVVEIVRVRHGHENWLHDPKVAP